MLNAMRIDGELDARRQLVMVLLVTLVASIPLLVASFPLSMDYYNHIARLQIIDQLISNGPDSAYFAQLYGKPQFAVPNIGMDVVVLALAQLFSVKTAGDLLFVITFALTFGGVVLLHYSLFRRISVWPVVACLFLHNWCLTAGFMSYLLGVGLFLCLFGLWVLASTRPAWQRFVIGAVFALLLFYTHLAAFGCYALAVGGRELYNAARMWNGSPKHAVLHLVVSGLPFALAIPLLLFATHTGENVDALIEYRDWMTKILTAIRTITIRNLLVDAITGAFVVFTVVVLLWKRAIKLSPEMLLPIALLILAWLATPHILLNTAYAAGRLPIAILYVLVASTFVSFREPVWPRVLLAGVVVVMLLRVVALSYDWRSFDRMIADFEAGVAQLEPESTLIITRERKHRSAYESYYDDTFRPLFKVSNVAVLDGRFFVPSVFARPDMHTLGLRSDLQVLEAFQKSDARVGVATPAEFDELVRKALALTTQAGLSPVYLILLNPETLLDYRPEGAELVHKAQNHLIFRID